MRSSLFLLCVIALGGSTMSVADAQGAGAPEIISETPAEAEGDATPIETAPSEEVEASPPPPTVPPPEAVPPQPLPKEPIGHLRVGGGIGLGFGSDITFFSISPQVSYIIKRIVEPGIALRYQYTRDRFPLEDIIWHTFGASLFTRLYPIPSIFFLIEGEILNAGFKQGDFNSGRDNYGNLFLGGGYAVGVGKGAFLAFSLKVNIFRNPFYPTNFPIFSFGAGYAF